jgi:hypothetical protein
MTARARFIGAAAICGVLGVTTAMKFAGASPAAQDAALAEQDVHAQHGAVEPMAGGHHHDVGDPHMKFTTPRAATAEERRRADALVATLRQTLEKYTDSARAIQDGYQPFLPNLPLPEYHFTNYRYGFIQAFTFDPARPTSLLYRKSHERYELVGAMYTAPRRMTEEQLNERVPLGVAAWHAHVNICLADPGNGAVDWKTFGFKGSIATETACDAAGGRFYPQLFGWMVHVYPYEKDPARIWGH